MVRIADYREAVTGKLKYRMKNALGEYKTKNINIRNGMTKGVINGLQEGTEYEYEVRVAGVVCRGFSRWEKRASIQCCQMTQARMIPSFHTA